VLGRELTFVELGRDDMITRWRGEGYDDASIEFFLTMSENPPVEGRTVSTTVQDVTGAAPRSFRQWATERAALFR
jgi:hypothetical protein